MPSADFGKYHYHPMGSAVRLRLRGYYLVCDADSGNRRDSCNRNLWQHTAWRAEQL